MLELNKKYKVRQVFHELEQGMLVKIDNITGIVGEITDKSLYIHHNNPDYRGGKGEIQPQATNHLYSFWFGGYGAETITILSFNKDHKEKPTMCDTATILGFNKDHKEKPTMCDTTTKVIRNLFKGKEQKALEAYGIINGDGGLTEKGQKEFIDFIYETGKTDKAEFIKLFVDKHAEDLKK